MKTTTLAIAAAMTAGTLAHAQEAVQWRVEDGGNGHWYRAVANGVSICWSSAQSDAELLGAHLATLTSSSEDVWVCTNVIQQASGLYPPGCEVDGPMIGGFKQSGNNWQWVTGEAFSYSGFVWSNGDGPEMIQFFQQGCGWDGTGLCGGTCGGNVSYIIEWSADCNGDGIVDYGQILLGELGDYNANGVPDVCECDADINDDGTVNGADISVLLGYWGQSGKSVVGDITGDGIVNGADLALLLGSWGPCQ